MQGIQDFTGVERYKKEYMVKINFLLLLEICVGRGVKKRILEGIYQYLFKLGVLFNIP
jgi:hypothetical protein